MKTERYRIGGREFDVTINSINNDEAEVTVNGVTYHVDILKDISSRGQDEHDSVSAVSSAKAMPEQAARESHSPLSAGDRTVSSPLPGVIVALKVRQGDRVKNGQVVAVLEAMKMENEIQSEYEGTVTAVNVSPGDSVPEGTAIVTIG